MVPTARAGSRRSCCGPSPAWTVAVWVVRIPMIALDDRSVGFKVVHAVLGLISIGLAAVVWRSTSRPAVPDESRPAVSAG